MYHRVFLISGAIFCLLISSITPLCVTTPGNTSENLTTPDGLPDMTITGTGIILYQDLEGGFYGLLSDDGVKYQPTNLEKKYAVNGTRVQFTVVPMNDTVSIQMWGEPVKVITMQALSEPGPTKTDPLNGTWHLSQYENYGRLMQPLTNNTPTLAFGTNKVTGNAGFNEYSGDASVFGSALQITNLSMTGADSPDRSVIAQQNQYMSLLKSVTGYSMNGKNLTLTDTANKSILVFTH